MLFNQGGLVIYFPYYKIVVLRRNLPIRDVLYPPDYASLAWNLAVFFGGGLDLLALNIFYDTFLPPNTFLLIEVLFLGWAIPLLIAIYFDRIADKIVPPLYISTVAGAFLFLTDPHSDTHLLIVGITLFLGAMVSSLLTPAILGLRTTKENLVRYSFKAEAPFSRIRDILLTPAYRNVLYLDGTPIDETETRVRLAGNDGNFHKTLIEIRQDPANANSSYVSIVCYKPRYYEIVKSAEIELYGKMQAPFISKCLQESTPSITVTELAGGELQEQTKDFLDYIVLDYLVGQAEMVRRVPHITLLKASIFLVLVAISLYFIGKAPDATSGFTASLALVGIVALGVLALGQPIIQRKRK